MRQLVALRRATILFVVLSIGLGALTARAVTDARRWTEHIDTALTNYALAQRSLQLNLVYERAGITRNYDPVNADLALAQTSLAALQKAAMSSRARAILDRLVDKNDDQGDLVEQFNSDNALVQNSLLYITHQEGGTSADSQLLFNRVLKLTLDTSPETVRDARRALASIREPADGSPAARSFSYGRLLIDILPEIDGLLSSIRDMKIERLADELQKAVREDAAERSNRVAQLELMLAAAIVLLIMTSATYLLVQRMHIRELQARAANEELSAAIAIPLIETGSGNFRSRIQEATDRLAHHIGARRLQLTIPGISDCLQFSEEEPLASDWLAKLVKSATADNAWVGDRVIALRDGSGRADGVLGGAMREAGIKGLVLLRTPEPYRVTVGFEPKELAYAQRSDYLAGLSSAMIAIAHSARGEAMQLERERLKQSLAEKRRMANLGAIASGVAHNFNNIIAAISGFAEIGQGRTPPGSAEYESFEEIQGSVVRARELIDDILSFAKRPISNKAVMNLNDILNESVRMLCASSRSDTAFQLNIPDEQYVIYGAQGDLQQVILNICNNAAHASDGRPVHIAVKRRELADKRQMSHARLYPGRYAVVTISDSGPGIPKALHSRLFEPFFTTKSAGTGLGLSTAWEVVQQHGGTINVGEAREGGARFSVWLPEILTGEGRPIVGDGARILLLTEGDRLSAEEDMLAGLGYEPLGFSIDQEVDKIWDAMTGVDAVLIAAWQSWRVNELVLEIAPRLAGRPLLLASMDEDGWRHSVSAMKLGYPIRADQVAALLSKALAARRRTPDEARRNGQHVIA